MTDIVSSLTVVVILGILVFLVISKMSKSNSKAFEKVKNWMKDKSKPNPKVEGIDKYAKRKFEEDRTIM